MVTVKVIVDGGKANAGPPLGPSLATAGIKIQEVVEAINEKTKDFEGIQVPVTVEIDPQTKKFEIKIGKPSLANLIKKELNVKKLAKAPFNIYKKEETEEEFKESLKFDQVIKIAKMKMDDMKTDNLKTAVKQTIGSCVSCGVYIEDKKPKQVLEEVKEGKWDENIK